MAVLDPHGDLAEELLDCIPSSLASRVIYFNATDPQFPITFNILATVEPDLRPRVAAGLVSAFKHVWGDSWGPRLEYILYNSLRALLDAENSSILGLPKLLVDPAYRRWVVQQVQDPFVQAFWTDEYEGYERRFRQEAIAPIQNKIGQLIASPVLRNILGQTKSKVDFRFAMDQGALVIANLAKGKIGEAPSNLLGAILVSEFRRAAMERADTPEDERRDFTLIVDEFQNFATDAFASILSEARKYHLSLALSHQFTAQLDPSIRDAVFGNAGTLLSFRTGQADAALLALEFGDEFPPSEFVDLPPFNTLVRPAALDGFQLPFRGRSIPFDGKVYGERSSHVLYSRQRYAAKRDQVEGKIDRWLNRWSR